MSKTTPEPKVVSAAGPASPFLSVEKAFRILEILSARSPLGVTEIADELGLKKSSVSRLLKALAELGYAESTAQRGKYCVGPNILVLARSYLEDDRLVREAQPILRELAATLRASAHVAVLAGGNLVIVAKEPSPEHIQVITRVGGRTPLHASALGKILLASLPEKKRRSILGETLARYTDRTITDHRRLKADLDRVREQGFAIELEEEHAGVGCIGAPVRDTADRWVAAVSVAGPLHGTPFKVDAAHRRVVVEKAAELSRRVFRA
ncbi:MAG: IclR family transcriptional regulator [Isosphaeraceae bacterium]